VSEMARGYSRDSLERALVHHGIEYTTSEEREGRLWFVHTGFGGREMTTPQVSAYVLGLADKERQLAARAGGLTERPQTVPPATDYRINTEEEQ